MICRKETIYCIIDDKKGDIFTTFLVSFFEKISDNIKIKIGGTR